MLPGVDRAEARKLARTNARHNPTLTPGGVQNSSVTALAHPHDPVTWCIHGFRFCWRNQNSQAGENQRAYSRPLEPDSSGELRPELDDGHTNAEKEGNCAIS